MRFKWQGKLHEFQCLAFGLSSAPWIFTKALKPVAAFFRRRGVRLIIYLDDILIMHQNRENLLTLAQEAIELFSGLGFLINWEKSHLSPSQVLEYLGTEIDSERFVFRLPVN